MTVRATARGQARTSLDGERVDVLVCGASFAGLAVARELARSGAAIGAGRARVLVLDRYEIGERATSACAAPTPWLHAMGVAGSIRSELPFMTFATPHGRVRYRLPWSWSAFDYRALCEGLWEQCGAPLSRGLEVHPHAGGQGDALDVWVERSLVRRGYGWRVPAGDEARIGVGSYEPRHHVREPTMRLAGRLDAEAVRYQGNWFPHRLRSAVEDGVFCVGDSAGHCFPLSGEGIRPAFYFGVACGRELAGVLAGRQDRDTALARYAAFHEGHAGAFRRALALQRLVPALPPRALTLLLRALSPQALVDRAFGWYLDQAHPSFASGAGPRPGAVGEALLEAG